MRIHAVAAVYVLFFAPFLGVSRAEYAVLLVCCGAVFAAECANTALERLADRVDPAWNADIGRAKDAAAGAVLAAAVFAAAAGVAILWRPAQLVRLLEFFIDHSFLIPVLALSVLLAVRFIAGGRGRGSGGPGDGEEEKH